MSPQVYMAIALLFIIKLNLVGQKGDSIHLIVAVQSLQWPFNLVQKVKLSILSKGRVQKENLMKSLHYPASQKVS